MCVIIHSFYAGDFCTNLKNTKNNQLTKVKNFYSGKTVRKRINTDDKIVHSKL